MINRYVLTKEQAQYAIQNGEFGNDVISSGNKVIVVMTQDWCPQWVNMRSWIYSIQTREDVNIYELIYNKTDFQDEFMHFKENQLGNDQIPYLRYYRDGKIIDQTNYVSESKLKSILEI